MKTSIISNYKRSRSFEKKEVGEKRTPKVDCPQEGECIIYTPMKFLCFPGQEGRKQTRNICYDMVNFSFNFSIMLSVVLGCSNCCSRVTFKDYVVESTWPRGLLHRGHSSVPCKPFLKAHRRRMSVLHQAFFHITGVNFWEWDLWAFYGPRKPFLNRKFLSRDLIKIYALFCLLNK